MAGLTKPPTKQSKPIYTNLINLNKMATLKFIRIAEQTEKAVKVIVRESGYDLEKFKTVYEKYFWIPKSVCNNLTETSVEVADWFYNKNIAADVYGAFMKSLANS